MPGPQSTVPVEPQGVGDPKEQAIRELVEWPGPNWSDAHSTVLLDYLRHILNALDAARASRPVTATAQLPLARLVGDCIYGLREQPAVPRSAIATILERDILPRIRRLLATLDADRASRPVTATALDHPAMRQDHDTARWPHSESGMERSGVPVYWCARCVLDAQSNRLAALPVREHPADHLPDPVTRTGIPATNAWCNRCGYFPLPLEGSRALPVREDEPTGIEEHCCNDPAHMSAEYLARIEASHVR